MKKTCFKCGQEKEITEFYRHPGMADGHLNKCKACARHDTRENRRANVDYYRAYDVTRAKEPGRKEKAGEVVARWRGQDKRRMRAHNMVRRAVGAGKLEPKPCERCGREDNIHAHHDDYSKPLDVSWLCPVHHRERHAELDAAGLSP